MATKKAKPRRIKAKSTVSRTKATKKAAPKAYLEDSQAAPKTFVTEDGS